MCRKHSPQHFVPLATSAFEVEACVMDKRSSRNMPDILPGEEHLARRILQTFDLRNALKEYKDDLRLRHTARLTQVQPRYLERSSPMGCTNKDILRKFHLDKSTGTLPTNPNAPSSTEGKSLRKSNSAPVDSGADFLALIMERNGKVVGVHPKHNVCVPTPLRCTYTW